MDNAIADFMRLMMGRNGSSARRDSEHGSGSGSGSAEHESDSDDDAFL